MYHRFDSRTRINMDVELRLHGHSLGRFQTRDIDSMGAFIEAPLTGLRRHDEIEVEFLFAGRRHSQRGTVVRCCGDGVAVMFATENHALFEALAEWLFERYPPAYGTLAS